MTIFSKERHFWNRNWLFIILQYCTLLLLTGCQSFFYMPLQNKIFDPAKINMHPDDVFLSTISGNKIHGWYFASTQKDVKGTVLFFHGNAENITSHFLMLRWLPDAGYNYFIFDYPGYGLSTGKPNPENTVEAGIAAAEWLHEKKDQRPLIIYGHSLGGIIAMRAVEEMKSSVPIRNVIIEASFSSYKKMGRRVLSRQWWTWWLQPVTYVFVSDKYSPEPISQIAPIPMLFIHGTEDHVIEQESSEELYEAAKDPKEIWMVPGRHGDLYEQRNGQLRQRLLLYLNH